MAQTFETKRFWQSKTNWLAFIGMTSLILEYLAQQDYIQGNPVILNLVALFAFVLTAIVRTYFPSGTIVNPPVGTPRGIEISKDYGTDKMVAHKTNNH